MSILGIGVDVVHVPRIAALLRKRGDALAKRILSKEEHGQWLKLAGSDVTELERARFMAVRWSTKEAAYKAMYPTVRPVWKDLTYCGLVNGAKPSLRFQPVANDARTSKSPEVGHIHVSVSHDGEYVFSSVLVESSRGNTPFS